MSLGNLLPDPNDPEHKLVLCGMNGVPCHPESKTLSRGYYFVALALFTTAFLGRKEISETFGKNAASIETSYQVTPIKQTLIDSVSYPLPR